jgi:hypothetical protein
MDHDWPQISLIIADGWRGFDALGICGGTPVADTLRVPVRRNLPGCASAWPTFQASLIAGPSSPMRDRLGLCAVVLPLLDSRTVQRSDGYISSSQPVGKTGVWSKLAWTRACVRRGSSARA